MRGKVIAAIAVAFSASCSTPQAPSRSVAYGFADPFGEVFRWPQTRSPVRYWVEDRGSLRAYVTGALEIWRAQFVYGEWSAVMVEDSAQADVVVLLVGNTPPPADLTNDPPIRACFGETAGQVLGDAIVGAVRTRLFWSPGNTATDVANCLARVTSHEIGHTLGLLAHSTDPRDLMFTNPTVGAPSQADRNTVQILYHTTPTLQPPTR